MNHSSVPHGKDIWSNSSKKYVNSTSLNNWCSSLLRNFWDKLENEMKTMFFIYRNWKGYSIDTLSKLLSLLSKECILWLVILPQQHFIIICQSITGRRDTARIEWKQSEPWQEYFLKPCLTTLPSASTIWSLLTLVITHTTWIIKKHCKMSSEDHRNHVK